MHALMVLPSLTRTHRAQPRARGAAAGKVSCIIHDLLMLLLT